LRVIYSRVAVKAINSFDKSIKQRIKTGIEGLLEVPPKGDIKQMQGIRISDHEGTFTSKGDDNMSAVSKQIIDMIDMLPESEQELAFEMIKRMVLAWDSDFTKLTPLERERLTQSEKEIANDETVSHSDIDWN